MHCSSRTTILRSAPCWRAQREGIVVPARVAIAGFNGLDISALTTPALTTIVSPRQRIGELAARKLLGRIQGGPPGTGPCRCRLPAGNPGQHLTSRSGLEL